MALKNMSIKKSDEIMTLYFDLLTQWGDNQISIYPYSALKGYDIFDIDNGLKIFLANLIFKKNLSDDEIKQYRGWGSMGIINYKLAFAPDDFVYELNKLDKNSSEYRIKEGSILERPHDGMVKIFDNENKEPITSFFDFCLSLGKNNPDYWKLVYDRLGIDK